MSSPSGGGSSSRFLFCPMRADFLTDAGRAINDDFLGDEERVVRRLAGGGAPR